MMSRRELATLAAKNGYPDPAQSEGHTCEACGAPVACEWRVLVEVRRHAQQMVLAANRLEAKLAGIPTTRPPAADFTVEEARQLLAELGSMNKVARRLGVARVTVQRAIGAVPPSVTARRGAR